MIRRRTALMLPLAAPALAQPEWPNRSIRLIATFEPGGGADQSARALAAQLGPLLGQSVVVENRTGAAGNIGTEAMVRANDGHTFLYASTGPITYHHILFRNLPFDPLRDLLPIAFAAHSPNIIGARADLPWRNINDLVAAARRTPGAINYGSAGIGTTQHLTMELLQARANIELTHVPYRGGAASLRDLLGGRLELAVLTGSGAAPIREGRVTALAVTGNGRIPVIADVPNMIEQAFPDFVATAWYGVVGPANTPAEIVRRMSDAVTRVTQDEGFNARMRDITFEAATMDTAAFTRFIHAERAKWEPIVRRLAGSMG